MGHRGFTLLEVLITLIILAIGMLGLANLQSKIHVTEMESYQRAQAVLLLQDMTDRINSNRGGAATYVSATVLGTGNADDDCTALATNTAALRAARDRCEWDLALKGASEQRGGVNVGGMIGARGCVELVQPANPAAGVCTPGIYRVTVAWQGLHKTSEPALTCGQNLYGDAADADKDKLRRVISTRITIGLPRCTAS
jgi:type IV pilus assembly protein PilV